MVNTCESCVHRKKLESSRKVEKSGSCYIVISGGENYECELPCIKNMLIIDGEMSCSEYEPKE